jgi:hypothetical protein
MSGVTEQGPERQPQVWRTLALVYLASNARHGSGLRKRRMQRVMSRDERVAILANLPKVPKAVALWSSGNAIMDPFDIVEVRRPLPTLSSSGGGNWWAAPKDCADDVRDLAGGKPYDQVYVLWPSDGHTPMCGWGCTAGPQDGVDGAGFSSIPSDHWQALASDPDPEQGYVHEWLHSVESEYRELGVTAAQVPTLHDAFLKSCRSAMEPPFGEGYDHYHNNVSRTWRPWYEDLMTGQVRKPDDSGCFGMTPELWALRTAPYRDRHPEKVTPGRRRAPAPPA